MVEIVVELKADATNSLCSFEAELLRNYELLSSFHYLKKSVWKFNDEFYCIKLAAMN